MFLIIKLDAKKKIERSMYAQDDKGKEYEIRIKNTI